MTKTGIMEELQQLHKQYPEGQQVQSLSPHEYTEVLTMHASRSIGQKFKSLAS
ncbi:hypothetical protein [Jeotgalibacillus marinus]|uniref:Uncharacterized protein n=1 Tax=Jeotgalibacillus marinus TaxID=86667 RepID=A0ABV3Q7X8_9BACL